MNPILIPIIYSNQHSNLNLTLAQFLTVVISILLLVYYIIILLQIYFYFDDIKIWGHPDRDSVFRSKLDFLLCWIPFLFVVRWIIETIIKIYT